MKYLSLTRLTIKKLQLLRCALIEYEDGIDNLKEFKIDEVELTKVIEDSKSLRHRIEKVLDLHHADYQYKAGKSETKPLR